MQNNVQFPGCGFLKKNLDDGWTVYKMDHYIIWTLILRIKLFLDNAFHFQLL